MREDFVQSVWKYQLFDRKNLYSKDGSRIEIIHQGFLQHHSGPDFSAAKIKIDDTLWVGNVEIHLQSRDWNVHKHFLDDAYNNVILHVVFKDDTTLCKTENGRVIPCIEIGPRISEQVLSKYEHLVQDLSILPCADVWPRLKEYEINEYLIQLALQRIEEKLLPIKHRLGHTKSHWEQVCFEFLCRHMGFHVNAEPMERLARSIPVEIIHKNADKPLLIDALLFGQAGMLERSFIDDYPNELKSNYRFLKKKYNLNTIDQANWKFAKLRPLNFPSIRIAQLSSIMYHRTHLFQDCLNSSGMNHLKEFLKTNVNAYWENHYVFDKESSPCNKNLGAESIEKILLNTLLLLWICYGQNNNEIDYINKAIDLMEEIKAEKNMYTHVYECTGFKASNAMQTQGLRFLWENYCDEKKCLNCNIGIKSLNI